MKRSSIFTKRKILLPIAVAGVVVTGGAFTFVNVLKPNVNNTSETPPQTTTQSVKQEVKDEAIGQVQGAIIDSFSNEGEVNSSAEIAQPRAQQPQHSDNAEAKEQYLQSLAYAYELEANAPDNETSFNVGLEEAYEAWDDELNKIYGLLKEKLSAEQMDALRKDERAWIEFKEKQVGRSDIVGAWTVKERGISLTTDRTLYLIDMYFDEPSTMKYVQLANEEGNIRAQPAIDSEVVYSGIMGDMFMYLQETIQTDDGRTWYKVEYSSGLIGYVSDAVCNLTNEKPKYVRILHEGVNIRTAPSEEATVVTSGDKDQIFSYSDDYTETADGQIWLHVTSANTDGYVKQQASTMTRSWGYDEF